MSYSDPQFRPGEPFNLETMRRVAELAQRTEHVSAGGNASVQVGAGGVSVLDAQPLQRFIRIVAQSPGVGTGVPPKYYYSWEPVRVAGSFVGGEYVLANPPWELDDQAVDVGSYMLLPAIETNGNTGVPLGTVVYAWLGDDGRSMMFSSISGGGTGGTTNYTNHTINYTGTTTTNAGASTTTNNAGTTNYASGSTTTFSGALLVQGPYYQPTYAVSQWTANQTNFALPAGNVRLRVFSDQQFRELRSIAPGASPSGRIVCLHNVGDYVILIVPEDGGSAAANRILTTTGNYYWLAPGHEVTLVYDSTSSRWRVSENSDERLGGVKTYTPWGSNQDNWAAEPQYEQHRVSSTAAVNLTGIQYGKPGLRHRIINHGTSYAITLKHEDSGSSATNRFSLPGGFDLKLHPRADLWVEYDGTTERWRAVTYRDIFTEFQIVHAAAQGEPTSTADFTREAEGIIRQTRDNDTTNPEHQLIRRRASAGSVAADDVIAAWSGYGKVDGVDARLLGRAQVVYDGTGSQVDGRYEVYGVEAGSENRGFTVHPDGDLEVENANAANELLGTDADGHVANITLGNGLSITGGQLSIDENSSVVMWTKITKSHTDLQAASTSNNIEIYNLPAKGCIHACILKWTTAFAGTGIGGYNLSVGTAGATTEFATTTIVSAAPSDTTFTVMDVGTFKVTCKHFGAATSVRLYATSTGANLNQSTAGSVDIYLLVSTAGAPGSSGITDGDYGDISVTGGGTTMTIDPGVVTFAKMQAVNANVLLGNDATGTTVEEITCTPFARTILDDADAAAVRATIGAGTGDVVGPSSSVASEIALFDGTTGKLIKRATGTGFVRAASGVYSAAAIATADLPDDGVTNAKLANMAASTIKARKPGSTGDPEDCTLSEVLDFVGSAAHGDILYRGASAWARLAAGTDLQLLRTAGAGANPAWAFPDMRSMVAVTCRAFRNVAHSVLAVPNNTWTTVTLPGENYDTHAMHDTSTNTSRLTVPTGMDGAWFLWIECNPEYSAGSFASSFRVMINGGTLTETTAATGVTSTLVYVQTASATDYFEAAIKQTSGSSRDFAGGGGYLSLAAIYLGDT